jgi:hypothetical protein
MIVVASQVLACSIDAFVPTVGFVAGTCLPMGASLLEWDWDLDLNLE